MLCELYFGLLVVEGVCFSPLQGHPFMASLNENRPLLYSLLISASVLFVLASGMFPDLSAMFEIELFTEEVSSL